MEGNEKIICLRNLGNGWFQVVKRESLRILAPDNYEFDPDGLSLYSDLCCEELERIT